MNTEQMVKRYERLLDKARTDGLISDPPSAEYRELCTLAAALNRPVVWRYKITRLYGDAAAQPAGVR